MGFRVTFVSLKPMISERLSSATSRRAYDLGTYIEKKSLLARELLVLRYAHYGTARSTNLYIEAEADGNGVLDFDVCEGFECNSEVEEADFGYLLHASAIDDHLSSR